MDGIKLKISEEMKDLDLYLIQKVVSILHYLEDIIISDTQLPYLLLNKYCKYLKRTVLSDFTHSLSLRGTKNRT